jgi:hypothetical protein
MGRCMALNTSCGELVGPGIYRWLRPAIEMPLKRLKLSEKFINHDIDNDTLQVVKNSVCREQ